MLEWDHPLKGTLREKTPRIGYLAFTYSMLGRPEMNRCPELLRPDIRKDVQTHKESPAPAQDYESRIEQQQSFICERTSFAPVQFIDRLLAFSDKIFYIKGYALGGQIYSEILINSIGGNTPFLGGYAECIIYTDTGYLRNLSKVIIYCI
jgi:hypothetical protein